MVDADVQDVLAVNAVHGVDVRGGGHMQRRRRVIRHRLHYFVFYDDIDFKVRFRLTKLSVRQLIDQIAVQLEHPTRKNNCINPELQVLDLFTVFCNRVLSTCGRRLKWN
jgi:hypothetical protein